MSVAELTRHAAATRARAKVGIVDCDIHPTFASAADIKPYLDDRWWRHLTTYGSFVRQPHMGTPPYPKAAPETARRDAWTPAGGRPGSDLDFMRAQHLDRLGIATGILLPLQLGANASRNFELGSALCRGINDWQVDVWTSREPRLRGSIVVLPEDAEAAVAEIERCAANPDFIQIEMPLRTAEPMGHKRYWPIFEAASRHDLPLGVHVNTVGGGHTSSGGGWPSFYFQEHQGLAQTMKALAVSLVFGGVFEAYPDLKVVMIEGGVGWAPALAWRMDRVWQRSRDEVPYLRRPPSEYLRENIWFTSQPVEEPENPDAFNEIMEWVGWDRLLFASDYPHWDCDDPTYAFPPSLSAEHRRMILHDNAAAVYRLR